MKRVYMVNASSGYLYSVELVAVYLADALSRDVAEATLDKLTTIFEKQFLPWNQGQGLEYIDRPRHPSQLPQHLEERALAKRKKQAA